MNPTLIKYNPAFLSREELVRSFVVREVDLELIIETVTENVNSSNQHLLVIGPRGMGKTMLVLRVAAYVSGDKELNSAWYPLVFSEESYEVWTAAEFWLQAVFHLGKQTGDKNFIRLHEQLKEERDDRRLYERALACLMDFADEQKKRLLVVVENLNMLMDDQMGPDETWNLRHTLLNEPRIMLMGTATSRFDEIDNSGKAMFELFRIHPLEPLDTAESKRLWESLTGREVEENRIRPLQILTGGNPRLLAIISSFALGSSFRELMEHLTSLIDEYTTYFKSNIEGLPSLERKIFVTLANIWEPATAARVARDARIDVNKVSSLLKRLETRGSVGVVKETGRKKSYQVIERLYNIYHLMRLSGKQSDRVRAVVDFMVNFYEGEELAKKIAQLTTEACSLELEERKDHMEACKEILHSVEKNEDREKIIQSINPGFYTLRDASESLAGVVRDHHLVWETPENGVGNGSTGAALEITVESHRRLISKNPDDPDLWLEYGKFMNKLKNYSGAENAFRKAIEINPKYNEAWIHLGFLLQSKLRRYGEAEQIFRNLIKADPEYYPAWTHLGILLHEKRERYDEAEQAFRKSIEINPEPRYAWIWLVNLQIERKYRPKQILDTVSQCLKLSDRSAVCLGSIAFLIFFSDLKVGFSLAEQMVREALEKEPDTLAFQFTYSSILGAQKKWKKALSIAPCFLEKSTLGLQFPDGIIAFFINAAAAGHAKEGLELLKNSPCAPYVEPLIVGLQMLTGEEYNAPQEVVEVAKDVVKRIEEKKTAAR